MKYLAFFLIIIGMSGCANRNEIPASPCACTLIYDSGTFVS